MYKGFILYADICNHNAAKIVSIADEQKKAFFEKHNNRFYDHGLIIKTRCFDDSESSIGLETLVMKFPDVFKGFSYSINKIIEPYDPNKHTKLRN